MKKLLSVILAVAIMVCVIPFGAFTLTASAATIDNAAFNSQIASLKTKFRSGEYWNAYNSCVYEGTGLTKCPSCSEYCRGDCPDSCGQFYYNGAWVSGQCLGWACKMGNAIFGGNPLTWGVHYNASNLKPGDIVYGNVTSVISGASMHAIFITGVSGNTVTYADCNSVGPCMVKWDRTTSLSAIATATGRGAKIYHASNNNVTSSNLASLTTPTISFNKSSYIVGDTVTISWKASPANSNLSHYYVNVYNPDGSVNLSQNIDKSKNSFSFKPSGIGKYSVKVWATPVGSQSGEGSLTDTKSFTVGNAASLVTPTISFNKSSYTVGDTVTISWKASPSNSNLSHYWINIYNPDGSVYKDQSVKLNTSFSFTPSGIGTYKVKVFATPIGSQSGEGSLTDTKSFTVSNKTTSLVDSGTTGDCSWRLKGNVLTISGKGAMGNYTGRESGIVGVDCPPWYFYSDNIESVVIEKGVTTIGQGAFYAHHKLISITTPNSIKSIDDRAFFYCENLTSITISDSVKNIGDDAFGLCVSLKKIYYEGSKTKRAKISIGSFNDSLNNANWYYNSCINLKAHKNKTTTTKATTSKNGTVVNKCATCGYVASKTTIKYAKSFKLTTTSYTYNGKVKTPGVIVKDSAGKTLKKNTDYTVTYAKGRKNVGTYKVTVKMKGKYTGTKTLTFKINPAKTSVSKLTAGKKSITVNISKKSTQVSGYQVQYSTSKSFKKTTTKTVSSYKTTKYTLKSLSAKKTYYVRVRTYKTASGKKYYSGWSSAKKVKTK